VEDEPPKQLPAFPGGPDPTQPVPRESIEGYDLARYAQVSALLAEGIQPRESVFAANGLTERAWAHIELTWMLRIATALLQGDQSLALEFDRLYVQAQDALGPTDPTMSLEQYAEVVARIEGGQDPVEVFGAHGLTLASAARLQRAWTRRLAQDIEMTDAFRAMVKDAKARLGAGG
jgi:hypothetical protein